MSVPSDSPMGARRRWGLAALCGVLLAALYPPFALAALGWVALTPLLLALDGVAPLTAFGLGWVAGAIGSLGVTGVWIFHAAREYFQASVPVAAAFTLGATQIFVGAYFGVFAAAVALLRAPRARVVLIPALLVTAEYARSHLLSGCPWDLMGHSQSATRLIQVCDLAGVYGVSFLLALAATALADLRRRRMPAVAAALAIAAALIYGEWRLTQLAANDRAGLPALLVQGNLPNYERGRPELFSTHLDRYLDLTRAARVSTASLVIWPENAVGFFPQENPALVARIAGLDTAVLTGAPRAGERPGVAALYNSAYLINGRGVAAVYDKRRLLPFVERLPLRPEDGPFLPGGEPVIFSVAGRRFGVLICYEAIYPELARALLGRGAQFLVNISNDSWFEAGAGPEQHYEIARFRAVENHVSLVRVTNSGVSGVIDPAGREIARLHPREAVAQLVTVPIGPGGSFYARHGDVFAAACIGVSLIALALRVLGLLPQ